MTKQKFGFTLAEVLIVIGIIGVVAALTLPNLNHATGDKEKVTKVKKIYSALSDAFDRAQVVYGNVDTWFSGLGRENRDKIAERTAKRITEFMKVSKDCGFDEGCFSNKPLLLVSSVDEEDENGDSYSNNVFCENYVNELMNNGWSPTYMVILADGISLGFRADDMPQHLKITVDIDGPNKGKNQLGNDIFNFSIIALPGDECDNGQIFPSECHILNEVTNPSSWEYAENATAWVVENGNLDYLKCKNELNWETKTSCE